MNLFDFTKEHYFHEAERRFKLTQALTLPVGLVAIFCGAAFNLVIEIGEPLGWIDYLTYVFLICFGICMILTIYYLIKAHWSLKYIYVATPTKVYEYKLKLHEYYKKNGQKDNVEDEIKLWLQKSYAKCTHHNTINNDIKATYLHKATSSIIISFILLITSASPHLINLAWEKKVPNKVELTNDIFK